MGGASQHKLLTHQFSNIIHVSVQSDSSVSFLSPYATVRHKGREMFATLEQNHDHRFLCDLGQL